MVMHLLHRLHYCLLVVLRVLLFLTLPVSFAGFAGFGAAKPDTRQAAMAGANQAGAAYSFPAGHRQLFPANRLIALYGTPDNPLLGAVGEQPANQTIQRVKQLAASYQPLMTEHAYPALELITTIASAEPTQNNDFSREVAVSTLAPWIKAAQNAGVYVVLDLQPGSGDFLTQAKQYTQLLREPNVGLALDPEWRIQPGKQHLEDIGSVDIDEVNATAAWLANLTRSQKLPQKLFLLHQFRLSMITDRQKLDATHPELATVIQMDGQGEPQTKLDTYAAITAQSPAAVRFGWKNFYAKDTPVRSPAETMQVNPKPWYISYQ